MIDPRSPCIIGIARETWRTSPAPEPLAMWTSLARQAIDDSRASSVLGSIDAVHLVHCMSWPYDDAPRRLAEALAIEPRFTETSVLAGTAGQRMVNSAAERMLRGESEVVLIVGGEALDTRRQIQASGDVPNWSHPAPDPPLSPIDLGEWISPIEWAHDVIQPTATFAALDTARRARVGVKPQDHALMEGQLLLRLSAVAERNEHAWFPLRREPAEITRVTDTNRMISSPYTKYMVAIMAVDMAAALLMTTHGTADELGIPADQRVYLRGWSFGRDATHLAERAHLHRSPAMEITSRDALAQAGIGIDDVAYLDLYSCFASSVLFATDALGIDPLGDRELTVTGGLPYHGGPASNYTTHSIAETVVRLRGESGSYGVVSGVGMHMTKHVWAVYGTDPGRLQPPDYDEVQRRIDFEPAFEVIQQLSAPSRGTIAAATVTFDRSGAAVSALIIADFSDGTRTYARTTDVELMSLIRDGEPVGEPVLIRPDGNGTNGVEFPS
jgi:acetyl-CoA C-acetyltransferase